MRKFLICVTFLLALGCELAPISPDQIAAMRANIPRCTAQRECEAMWSAARNWVTSSCAMKIQTMTDTFIETYNSNFALSAVCRSDQRSGTGGGYSFHVAVSCEGGAHAHERRPYRLSMASNRRCGPQEMRPART